jgi:hypothetical protein
MVGQLKAKRTLNNCQKLASWTNERGNKLANESEMMMGAAIFSLAFCPYQIWTHFSNQAQPNLRNHTGNQKYAVFNELRAFRRQQYQKTKHHFRIRFHQDSLLI